MLEEYRSKALFLIEFGPDRHGGIKEIERPRRRARRGIGPVQQPQTAISTVRGRQNGVLSFDRWRGLIARPLRFPDQEEFLRQCLQK
jgi:hypothetical protein